MIICNKRKIERVQILVKETKKDTKATLKWLFDRKYHPTDRRPVLNLFVHHNTKGATKCRKPMEIAKKIFLITAERTLK